MTLPRALVVDPDPTALFAMSSSLEQLGWQVTAAPDFDTGAWALQTIPFEAVVTAERLNQYNGLHLALRALSNRPQTIAVVTSPAPSSGLTRDAAAVGAVAMTSQTKKVASYFSTLWIREAQLA